MHSLHVAILICCLSMWLQIFQKAISSSDAYNDQFRYHEYLIYKFWYFFLKLNRQCSGQGTTNCDAWIQIMFVCLQCVFSVYEPMFNIAFIMGSICYCCFFQKLSRGAGERKWFFLKFNWSKLSLGCSFVGLFTIYMLSVVKLNYTDVTLLSSNFSRDGQLVTALSILLCLF